MASPQPKTRFSKVMEILLWLAGLGVLAENIFLSAEPAPEPSVGSQITAGTQQGDGAGPLASARCTGHSSQRNSRVPSRSSERAC